MSFRCSALTWEVSPTFTLSVPNLEIPAGSTTLVLGPSGCGKSTFLALLGRVNGSYFSDWDVQAPSGTCHLIGQGDEVELVSASEAQLLRGRVRGDQVGFVFQQEALFSDLSPCENVAWSLLSRGMSSDEATDRAQRMLEQVGLAGDRETASLSGGERKRLAFARTMVLEPRVLLLDEPFTGLDPQAHSELLGLLKAFAADETHTVVMVTHQRKDLESIGDMLIFMDEGSIRAAGPRESLQEVLTAFLAGSDGPPESGGEG